MELDKFREVDLVIDHVNNHFFQNQFVSQNDNAGRSLTVQVTNNGVIGEVPGLTLNLRWHNRNSGLTDLSPFNLIDKEHSVFQIYYPKNMLNPGTVVASIQIIQNGQVSHSRQFEITVQQLQGEAKGIITKAEYGALIDALADANKFRTDIDRLNLEKASVTQMNALKEATDLSLARKVDKNGNEQVTYAMLSQDVKTKFTGGSVAVVGTNAVNTSNLVNDSVTTRKRTPLGEFATIVSSMTPNIDTTNRTISFGDTFTRLIYRNKTIGTNQLNGKTITIGGDVDGNFVYFNVESGVLSYKVGLADLEENDLFLGYCFWGTKFFFFNFPFTVDGLFPTNIESIPNKSATPFLRGGQLVSIKPILIDPTNKNIHFPNAHLAVVSGTTSYSLAYLKDEIMDLSNDSASYMCFDTETNELISLSRINLINEKQIYLGYINWGSSFAVDIVANYAVIDGIAQGNITKRWLGKTGVFLGDSITYGDNGIGTGKNSNSWTAQMIPLAGFSSIRNLGKKGSRVAMSPGRTDSFVERIEEITDVDGVITIWGGINDFHWNVPLGSDLDTEKTTFKGAYKYVLKTILENNPNAKILCITPMKSTKYIATYNENGQLNMNDVGATQEDYVQAIKMIAQFYSVPVLDMFAQSNMNPFITSHGKWFGDGLHPSNEGYLRIAKQIHHRLEIL